MRCPAQRCRRAPAPAARGPTSCRRRSRTASTRSPSAQPAGLGRLGRARSGSRRPTCCRSGRGRRTVRSARDAGAGQHGVDDAEVGLVGHEQVDVVGGARRPGPASGRSRPRHGPHRPAEHLAAVHPQVVLAGGHGLGAVAGRSAPPAGTTSRSTPARSPTRSLATRPGAPGSSDRPAGQDQRRRRRRTARRWRGRRVDDAGQRVGPDHAARCGRRRRCTSADAGGQGVDEPGAGGVEVEGAGGDAQLGGHDGGGGGHGPLGRAGGHDHEVDVGGGRGRPGRGRGAAAATASGPVVSPGAGPRGARGCRCARRSTRRRCRACAARSSLVTRRSGQGDAPPGDRGRRRHSAGGGR